ncbi:UPF0280 family protein, partial [bacterium]|nr:UPF0280 family protein [bacterium]
MAKPQQHAFYRDWIGANDLIPFTIAIKETDLLIFADKPLTEEAEKAVLQYRHQLEAYIQKNPEFLNSLIPLSEDEFAPSIIKEMMRAAMMAQVGPMASVAGAVAEKVGTYLLDYTRQIVVENGGDIFLHISNEITIGVYAGNSPLSNKLGLKITSFHRPLGVCTSSGTVGHSISFGKSDAVTVIADSASLADATATAVGNRVKGRKDIARGLQYAQTINGIMGTLIIVDDTFGAWGNIDIVS